MNNDKIFLKRAIEIALEGIDAGSGPFGAVLVKDSRIISESANNVVRMNDPTAHAEILVIREACSRLGTHDLAECILYSSCEPCPMCLGAIYWSGIKRVVYASDRNDAEEAGFSDRFIYDELEMKPQERSIEFQHIKIASSEMAFEKWRNFEDKITY